MKAYYIILVAIFCLSISSRKVRRVNGKKTNTKNGNSKWLQFMPPHLNQNKCANCWANSLSTMITTKYNLLENKRNSSFRISVQQIMDCVTYKSAYLFKINDKNKKYAEGCKALEPDNAENIIMLLESWMKFGKFKFITYPVVPKEEWEKTNSSTGGAYNSKNCKINDSSYSGLPSKAEFKIKIVTTPLDPNFNDDAKREKEIKEAIDKYGPLFVNVKETKFDPQNDGVVAGCKNPAPNYAHSMIMFHYDATHWYVRNSWEDSQPLKFPFGKNNCDIETLVFAIEDNYKILKINFDTGFGNALYISGNNDYLGNWKKGKRLVNMTSSIWEFRALPQDLPENTEYKLILFKDQDSELNIDEKKNEIKWELPEGVGNNQKVNYNNMEHSPKFS